jgi:protein-disulfide isomerase
MASAFLLKPIHGAVLMSLLASSIGFGQTSRSGSPKLWGVVDGEEITEDQVKKAADAVLQDIERRKMQAALQFQRDEHSAYERTLENMINKKLIELEAKKRSVDAENLIRSEVDIKVSYPSDRDVNNFYEENKARIPLAGDEALRQVREYLLQQRREAASGAFIAQLRKEYKVESYLEPIRFSVATDSSPTKGPADAPVTIVEFADFECPYCEQLFPTLKRVEANYDHRVRIVYRQFPLNDLHPHAQKAAEASLCANEQQKFWDLHDSMYLDQHNLDVDSLKRKAAALKLDTTQFNNCLDTAKYADAIKKDVKDGTAVGINGTPAMFINGRYLSGAQPYEQIATIIDEELRRASKKN